ncbi:TetR/AcrR family transcriptional regulator [Gluconacetobacter azotocaptans]|uniref:TetR/AcrR family transcriptional regulator n=1 Tax=Gluconacetobacter azotocaptans TaxID=142834 RepID=UPI001958ACE5|nr:TetR/AcrR family transcriptional regulator [Gluconacetobacter azotocaptans]MBM9400199.1 TetR/AcrR family transcriptional regulator [Gluconacetobacter azotocaptans]
MSSQKAISPEAPVEPVAPKRQRGRLRVAAILAAASDTFQDKGFDGATMTEIAARSGTAIGSLYRFFPTKDVLADALLGAYFGRLNERLDHIAAQARQMEPGALADALVDMALDLLAERAAALILVEARRNGPYRRGTLRNFMRGRICDILREVMPGLPPARAATVATLLLHLLKTVPALAEEERTTGAPVLAELRRTARLYIGDAAR